MTFAELELSPEILRSIDELGFTEPTPIQQEAIPQQEELRKHILQQRFDFVCSCEACENQTPTPEF